MSVLNIEGYSTARARAPGPDANAVGPAIRTKRWQTICAAIYTDPLLTPQAVAFGDAFRAHLGGANDGDRPIVYANFAVGNESVETLYGTGARLERLKALKQQYDPKGVFSHFIPIA